MHVVLEYGTADVALGFDNGYLLGDVLQLADIAVPGVVDEILATVVGEEDGGHVVFLGHVAAEFAEKERDVVLAFA